MPYQDEELDEGRGLLRVWTGTVTAREVIAATAAYYAEEDWDKLKYVIVDYSGVTKVDVTPNDIGETVRADQKISTLKPQLVIAIVAPADFVFGMSRMWEIQADRIPWTLGVFRSRPEAKTWVRERLPSLD